MWTAHTIDTSNTVGTICLQQHWPGYLPPGPTRTFQFQFFRPGFIQGLINQSPNPNSPSKLRNFSLNRTTEMVHSRGITLFNRLARRSLFESNDYVHIFLDSSSFACGVCFYRHFSMNCDLIICGNFFIFCRYIKQCCKGVIGHWTQGTAIHLELLVVMHQLVCVKLTFYFFRNSLHYCFGN